MSYYIQMQTLALASARPNKLAPIPERYANYANSITFIFPFSPSSLATCRSSAYVIASKSMSTCNFNSVSRLKQINKHTLLFLSSRGTAWVQTDG